MEYTALKNVRLPVSRIILGTAFSPMNQGEAVDEVLDNALALGINCFDTAAVYGDSEASLGDWIQRRGNRDQVLILTKGAHPTVWRNRVTDYDIRSDLATSLAKLRTDFVDMYLLLRDDPSLPVGPIVTLLNELKAEGKIHAFGGSNWTHERLEAANEYAYAHNLTPFTLSSPNFGLADQKGDPWGWGSVSIAGSQRGEARDWYRRTGMPVLAYSSLGNGFFSGRFTSREPEKAASLLGSAAQRAFLYPDNLERLARAETLAAQLGCTVPQVALAYLLRQEGLKTFAIVASRRPSAMAENCAALEIPLTPAQCRFLESGEA